MDKITSSFESLFIVTKTHSKILILAIASLVSTFTILIVLPFLKEYLAISYKEKRHQLSIIETSIHSLHLNMCKWKKNFLIENYLLLIVSLPLTLFLYVWNSFSFRNKKINFDFIVPMNPFSKSNRFITCIIYAAYINSISNIFEFSLTSITFTNDNNSNDSLIEHLYAFQSFSTQGILIDLMLRILNVFVIGFQFYPILLCIEFKTKSKMSYFMCSVYAWLMFFYFTFSNELCQLITDDIDLLTYFTFLKNSFSSFLKQYLNDELVDSKFVNNRTLNLTLNGIDSHEYKIEEFIFYFILCLIAASLSFDFILIVLTQLTKYNKEAHFLPVIAKKNVYIESDSYIAIKYTMNKLNENKFKHHSSLRRFVSTYIYSNCKYFKFSKQFLNINIIF